MYEEEKDYITRFEGFRNKVYIDTVGKRTIGIGFNLDRLGAVSILKTFDLNLDCILKGDEISFVDANRLLNYDVEIALRSARKFAENYDTLPRQIQLIIVDMAFNLGCTGLFTFKKFQTALNNHNYNDCACELKNSKWHKQTGSRSRHHIGVFLTFA